MADHDNEEKEQPAAALMGNGAPAATSAPKAASKTASKAATEASSESAPESVAAMDQPDQPVDEMAALRAELDETKDRLLRERADLENYKKRAAREKADALQYGSETLLRELLPVIDNLERAADQLRARQRADKTAGKTAGEGDDSGADAVVAGIEMVHRGFVEALERHGVKVVAAQGATFDPTVHEAIGHVESEHPANTVIDEHQRGYALHGRLLRPALVTVGKGPSQQTGQEPGQAPESKPEAEFAQKAARSTVEKPQDDG